MNMNMKPPEQYFQWVFTGCSNKEVQSEVRLLATFTLIFSATWLYEKKKNKTNNFNLNE